MLKIIVTFCDYISLQLLYSYLKTCWFQSGTESIKVFMSNIFKLF